MMYTKEEASEKLGITSGKRKRLCEKHFDELSKHGYIKTSKFINDACIEIIESKLNSEKERNMEIRIISKDWVAKKAKVSRNTLMKAIHKPRIYGMLEDKGYIKSQKKLTKEQYDIIEREYNI